MNIDDFAKFVFIENKDKKYVQFDIDGLETAKDLFLFFVDLTTKGFILLYGENNSVEIDKLNLEKFNVIKQCLELVGIHIILSIEINNENKFNTLNKEEIQLYKENELLETYIFKMYSIDYIYKIIFKLKN